MSQSLLDVTGTFTGFELIDKNGNVTKLDGTVKNMILDGGLNRMGTANTIEYCYLGTGNSAVNATQIKLDAQVAASNSVTVEKNNLTCARTYEFAARTTDTVIKEMGLGWGTNTAAAGLFCRALIPDGNDQPTQILWKKDTKLRVTHILKLSPPTADITGVCKISGVDYNYIARPSSLGGWRPDYFGSPLWFDITEYYVFSGNIRTAVSYPSGGYSTAPTVAQSYVDKSNQIVFEMTSGATDMTANRFAEGIRSASIQCKGCGWQWQFSRVSDGKPIPKTDRIVKLMLGTSWGR